MLLHRFEGELVYHVIESDTFRHSLLATGVFDADSVIMPATMSPHLKTALAGSVPA
jgi:uncharacterized Fe-S center protein